MAATVEFDDHAGIMFELNLLIGPLFAAVGVAAAGHTWWQGQKVNRSLTWLPAPGTITRSDIGTSRLRNGGHVYEARIEYDYEVGGMTHHGSTICIGGELNTSFRGRAEERCTRYPVGARVDVFHDPHRPGQCCLERTREGAWMGYGIGGLFGLVGLLVMGGVINFG